jgi:hypothetical protein
LAGGRQRFAPRPVVCSAGISPVCADGMSRNDHKKQASDRLATAQMPDPEGAVPLVYRILYFRSSVLEDWEMLEARDLMDALQTASSRAPDLTVELWGDRKKIAVFRPVNRH